MNSFNLLICWSIKLSLSDLFSFFRRTITSPFARCTASSRRSTNLIVSVNKKSGGSLTIYDLIGNEVRRLFDGTFDQGNTKIVWNGLDNQGSQVGGGIYICQMLVNGAHIKSQKITLIK